MKNLSLIAAGIVFAVSIIAGSNFAMATSSDAASDGKHKINLAGRQRMLTQRMAKAVCFASINVQTAKHLSMAKDAHALFDKTLNGLQDGDDDQSLMPEKNPKILMQLSEVVSLWENYGDSILKATASAEASAMNLPKVSDLNVPTLKQMNRAVGEFERHYGNSAIHPSLALAINISGRQRMLSQKASKEFCLIVAGQNVAANREALGKTIKLFESSLLALMDGSEELSLPEAPTDEIYEQLELVNDMWAPLKSILEKAAAGHMIRQAEVLQIADKNNPLLVEMNKAVTMYDKL